MGDIERGSAKLTVKCPGCGGINGVEAEAADANGVRCANCGAFIMLPSGATFDVRGEAGDVRLVATELLAAHGDAEARATARFRNPWVTGSFYLVALLAIVTLLLVVTAVAPPWVLVPIIVGGLLAVLTIGALQLRQDDRLSEKGFLKLMALTLKRLPLVARRAGEPPTAS